MITMGLFNKKTINYESEKTGFENPYYEPQQRRNRMMATMHYLGKDTEFVTKIMNEQATIWFASSNPYLIALNQLKLGRDKIILEHESVLYKAIAYTLNLEKMPDKIDLMLHWNDYLKQIEALSKKDITKNIDAYTIANGKFATHYNKLQREGEQFTLNSYRRANANEVCKWMTEESDIWYMSNDPLVLALHQLQLGKDKLIVPNHVLVEAIQEVLDLDYPLSFELLQKDWNDYFNQTMKAGGERTKQIIYIPTQKEYNEEMEDIFKITI